jgi:hypothetical protein
MRNRLVIFFIVIIPIFLSCSAVTNYVWEENYQFSPVLKSGEALTIISDKERMFRGCLSEAIIQKNLNLHIISSNDFRKKMLSGVDKEKLNQGLESLISILKNQEVNTKLKEFNLRYIIVIQCITDSNYLKTDWEWGTAPPGGVAVMGDHEWGRVTTVEANLVDVKQDFRTGRLITRSCGKYHLITTCCIPTIGSIPRTENEACKALAKKIVTYWVNDKSEKYLNGGNGGGGDLHM